jgi:hypothetical protein
MPTSNDASASEPASPACGCDNKSLELVGTTPRVGPYPELKTFRCNRCGEVVTLEAD